MKEIDEKDEELEDIYKESNTIGKVLHTIGWIILIIGLVGGVLIQIGQEEFNIMTLIYVWSIFGFGSLLTIGFGEVIVILHDIRKRLYKKK